MGATNAFILSADGSPKNTHCSKTCSIVLFCTIVPFCILSILFLVVYASCGHRYLARKRQAREWQRQQKEMEFRKLRSEDNIILSGNYASYSREEDGLAGDQEKDLEAAPAPPPIARERPGGQRASVEVAAWSRR